MSEIEKSKFYPIPEPFENPTAALVMNYKLLKGVEYDDRSWDKRHWMRCSKSAKELLEICDLYEVARRCMEELAENFNNSDLSWTLETITKHCHEWKQKRGKKDDAKSRQRFFDALINQRSNSQLKIEGTLNGAEMVGSLRNIQVIQPDDGPKDGRGNPKDGGLGKGLGKEAVETEETGRLKRSGTNDQY